MLSRFKLDEFIFCWPGDEPVEMQWAGEPVVIPGRDEVAVCGVAGSPYRFPAAIDASGKPLKGTVVLTDVIRNDHATGGTVTLFDARAYALGIETNNKPLLDRGLEIVEDVAQVAEALLRGRPKYEEIRENDARNTIAEELTRRTYWEKQGLPAPRSTSSESIDRAMRFMETRAKTNGALHKKEDMLRALGGLPDGPGIQTQPPVVKVEELSDAAALCESLLYNAEEAKVTLTKDELKGLLKRDPAVMNAVSQKLELAVA